MSKIKCRICDNEFSVITPTHLMKHEYTVSAYQSQYPDAPLISAEKLAEKKEKLSKSMTGKVPYNKGISASEEQKRKQSETMKKKYNNGEIIHWNTGKHHSHETKEKISSSLQGKSLTNEHRQNISLGLQKMYHDKKTVCDDINLSNDIENNE